MDLLFIALFGVALCVYVVTKWPFDVRRKSDRQIVYEYTVYLHKKSLRDRAGRLSFTSSQGSPAEAELRRRGFDPEKVVAERFDAKREGRPMRWETCRLADDATAVQAEASPR